MPVLGLVHVSTHARADRYTYLPSIGLAIALVFAGARLATVSPVWRRGLAMLAALAVVVLTACSFRQASFWRERRNLVVARAGLRPDQRRSRIRPGHTPCKGRACWTRRSRHYRLAEQHAIDSSPTEQPGHSVGPPRQIGRGDCRISSGLGSRSRRIPSREATWRRRWPGRAVRRIENISAAPSNSIRESPTHCDLAHLLLRPTKHRTRPAAEFERAIELDPRDTAARNDLATTLLQQGKFEQAIPQLEAALAIDPRFLPARLNLALALEAPRPNGRGHGSIPPSSDHRSPEPHAREARKAVPPAGPAARSLKCLGRAHSPSGRLSGCKLGQAEVGGWPSATNSLN